MSPLRCSKLDSRHSTTICSGDSADDALHNGQSCQRRDGKNLILTNRSIVKNARSFNRIIIRRPRKHIYVIKRHIQQKIPKRPRSWKCDATY
eukprot:scaffold251529_cov45-Prasinocladus_malaysianus.AAC.1